MASKSRRPESCPTEVDVIGKTYTVELVEDLAGADRFGECDEAKLRIRIEKGTALAQEQDTLLHEILHAIDGSMHTKLSERQVGAIASGILAVLKANPRLALYLLS